MKFIYQLPCLALAVFPLLGSSCIGMRDYGPVITETREVSGFDGIEISHGIDAHLTMDSKEHLIVEVPEDLVDHLMTVVEDDKLRIYFDRSFSWNSQTKVFISAKRMGSITASGGANVKGENMIESRDLELKASGGSDIYVEVDTQELNVHVSGGADINLLGRTDYIYANTSGGSDLKAYDLIAKVAELEASGGSDIKMTVEQDIKAKASGGADIMYKGDPKVTEANTSSGADIRKTSL